MDVNVNANVAAHTLSECIKETKHIGGVVYNNICNGSSYYVQWGSADWALALFFTVLATLAVTGALFIGIMLYREYREA